MKGRTLFPLAAAATGWMALALQFVLLVGNPAPPSAPVSVINFFSYFTILTNIIAAAALTASVIADSRAFLNAPSVRAAIAVYIFIVGIIYHLLLRELWDPQGWQLLADRLLHYAMPALFLLDWAIFGPRRGLSFAMIPRWLVYPAFYGAYAIARGALTGFVVYPFLDAAAKGYAQVFATMAAMLAGFAATGAIFIMVSRLLPLAARD